MAHEPHHHLLAQARLGGNATTEHASKLETPVEIREGAENTLRMLIENLPMGLVISDERGHITDLNESSLRMFGYSRQELLGQPVEILLPERFRKLHTGQRRGYGTR